eukprot:1556-Heterococcus_DN1.PRE.3
MGNESSSTNASPGYPGARLAAAAAQQQQQQQQQQQLSASGRAAGAQQGGRGPDTQRPGAYSVAGSNRNRTNQDAAPYTVVVPPAVRPGQQFQ